ncbi:MAG: isoleucine--tRNA ligase [Defluviitaleaceae bacterium]|nr:isoleucine--tRNA ligase [Defluviitaleaceae bacterium]
MFEKVNADLKFAERELETLKFWKENEIFEKSINQREGGPVFTFYDGPPTANGKPHIGHVITRAVKDIIPRYKAMKGYHILRKAGWDTHGLPVELEVEKALGISGKPEIEKYGVEPFIKQCKESVWKYETAWREMSDRVGYWVDMDDPYVTYKNEYIESVWWSLKNIWDQGLLYKGYKTVPYCPRCGTALSSHELAQGYKDVKEVSAIAKFKIKDIENGYFLAWTTTPWTLPSNVGLAVNAKETYAKVQQDGNIYILAEALLDKVLGEGKYEVIEKVKGTELEHIEYVPLFNFVSPSEKAWYIVCDDYVTLTDGTGIVHIAPAFGEDDNRIGKKYGLPLVNLVDEQGNFVKEAVKYAGIFVKDADPIIIEDMRAQGTLFKAEDYEHSYPHCWRCHSPLIYYARESWFIKMTAVRDKLTANNNTVNWLPDNIKEGRFGNFLENVIDWGLSRERYWGTPLPIWECGCGHRCAVGSIEELKSLGDNVPDDIELHRPYIDKVLLNCEKCGGKMNRVPEVIDCWYDSGAMPFAQWHYPFENKEIFEQNFPADFISEAIDQTRGWFYTLIAISTLLFEKSPYKNVIVLGHVTDKDGKKMSKHIGNVVDPWDALNKQGADAVRWYFFSNSAPWLPSRFYDEAVSEGQRKFMGTLWNTYAFFVLYANIDGFNPADYKLEYDKLDTIDKWILSKLNTLVKYVDNSLDEYKLTEPSRAINDFVDELSNWYVRRSRERFWAKDMPQYKINAYMTLYTVLTTLSKLCAPFVPFMTEEMYKNLVKSVDKNALESVHLCNFPEYNESFVDKSLEKSMDEVLEIVVLGRAARNSAVIKNRQPIGKMFVCSDKKPLSESYVEIIADELNVKEIVFTDDSSSFTTYKFKPQLKTLGPKYGKLLSKISQALNEANGNELMDKFNVGDVTFNFGGEEAVLTKDDVLIESLNSEGFAVETDKGITVVLDTVLTEELIEEGFVREIISKVQTMRKEAGFEVLDRIEVSHKGNDKISEVIKRNNELICAEVLADTIKGNSADGFVKDWNINGEAVTLGVLRK